MEEIKKWSSLF